MFSKASTLFAVHCDEEIPADFSDIVVLFCSYCWPVSFFLVTHLITLVKSREQLDQPTSSPRVRVEDLVQKV